MTDETVPVANQYRKLKDFRGFFGLSVNGFRLYEQAGLCHPQRVEGNSYRVCSLSDAVLMCNAFNYTHLGLSLKKTSEVLVDGSLQDQYAVLVGLNDSFTDELVDLLAKKRHVESELRSLSTILREPLACEALTGVSLYNMPIHSQQLEMGPGYDDGCVWWSHVPFVNAGLLVTIDEEWRATDVQHGPVAQEEDVARLRLPTGHAVHFCEPDRRYLHAYVSFGAEDLPDGRAYAHIIDYMESNGLSKDGDRVLHRLLRHQTLPDGSALRHDEVYVPLA